MDSQEYASPVFSSFGGMGGPGKAIPYFQVSAFPAFFVANPTTKKNTKSIPKRLISARRGRECRHVLVVAKHLQVLDL